MARKSKLTMSNSMSGDDLKAFDELVDDSFNAVIGDETEDTSYVSTDITEENEKKTDDYNDFQNDDAVAELFSRKDKICPFADKSMNNYESVNDKMIEIYNDFVKDTTLSISNISSVSMNEAYIKARWCSKLMEAKIQHKKLKNEYKELQNKIREMVTEKSKTTAFLKQKMSIDSVVNNDANLKELWKRVEEAGMLEELYAYYYDIIKGLGYQIRNSIDTLNFERGM